MRDWNEPKAKTSGSVLVQAKRAAEAALSYAGLKKGKSSPSFVKDRGAAVDIPSQPGSLSERRVDPSSLEVLCWACPSRYHTGSTSSVHVPHTITDRTVSTDSTVVVPHTVLHAQF